MSKLISSLLVLIVTLSVAYCNKARIVGGSFAAEKQFPHQISLQFNGGHRCGGSIVNAEWIVTAAHCVVDKGVIMNIGSFVVQAGTNVVKRGGQVRMLRKIIVHGNYANLVNDISLLQLAQPLEFNDAVKPISLMSGEVPSGQKIVISGWGQTGHKESLSKVLKFNTLTAINRDECIRRAGNVKEGVICLDHSAGDGACMGDSGGPAVWNGKLIGITSYILNTCGSDLPDGYVKVSYYLSWISQNMK